MIQYTSTFCPQFLDLFLKPLLLKSLLQIPQISSHKYIAVVGKVVVRKAAARKAVRKVVVGKAIVQKVVGRKAVRKAIIGKVVVGKVVRKVVVGKVVVGKVVVS